MRAFIIHITDPAGVDQRISVQVARRRDVGRAAQLAIDDVLASLGGDFAYPLFIDIHPAEDFPSVEKHYAKARERGASVN